MKWGMPSLVEFNSIEENVSFAKANNLSFVELNMDLPYCQNKLCLSKYNFDFTMHLSEELNVAELNDNLRKAYLKEAIRQINIGIKNGIRRYTIHLDSGVYFTLPNEKYYLNEKYCDIYQNNFNNSCKVLNDLAKDNNIMINFENTKIHNFIYSAIDIINQYEYLGFTLDIGHNEKNDNKAYSLFKKSNKIRHIHMHDYDGKNDHLAIGDGIIDFTKYKNEIKNNYVVIEVKEKNQLISSIKKISNLF
jgi:sugar phosphate isomerase/epimerase